MIRHLSRTLLAAGGALALAGPAAAQYPTGYPVGGYPGGYAGQASTTPARPPLSPYLNILQGTGNPAVNYYNFTRPALQAQQQQQLQANQPAPQQVEQFPLASIDVSVDPRYDPTKRLPRPTGHPTMFGYSGSYFNSLGTIGGPVNRGAGQAATPRPPATPRR
jgi:hypothetical protein